MNNRSIRRVPATLTALDGRVFHVQLDVTTVALLGQNGIEDEAIARVELASSNVPDGEYMLDYFCFSQHSEAVRVEHGVLLTWAVAG